jgi:hypothetical protein
MAKFKIGDKITYEDSGMYCIIDEVEEDFGIVDYWGLWYYKESGQCDGTGRCYIPEEEALPYGDTTASVETATMAPATYSVQEALDFLISQGYTVTLTS